jgi:trehalose utilization protein
MPNSVNALVWSEGTEPEDVYPDGIRGAVAEFLSEESDIEARTRSIEDESQGVSESDLEWADVVLWWGHLRHDDVTDETVDRVERHVREDGVGFVSLHSAHYARPYKRLIDASGDLGGHRLADGESEYVEVRASDHPIAEGVDDFTIPEVEMFAEPYDIPEPETVVFHSEYSEGDEQFRSGVTFQFDEGRGFYFRPGHEEFEIYRNEDVQRALVNATRWAGQ